MSPTRIIGLDTLVRISLMNLKLHQTALRNAGYQISEVVEYDDQNIS